MLSRRSFCLCVSFFPLPGGPALRPQASVEPPAKVSSAAWNAAAAAAGAGADVIVTAQGYPDLSLARILTTKEAKTRFVVDTLTRYADVSQTSLRRDLAFRKLPYQVLWLTNSVAVPAASQATLVWLAARTDVRRVDLDMKGKGIEMAQPAFTNLAAAGYSLQSVSSGRAARERAGSVGVGP